MSFQIRRKKYGRILKYCGLFCISLLLTLEISAQWQSLGRVPTLVHSIDFTSRDTGFAVGRNTILRTSNGGQDWVKYELPHDVDGIHFPSTLVGYAVGNAVYKTVDGGLTWMNMNIPFAPKEWYWNVHFADEMSGVMQGNQVRYTIDGGVTWLTPINNNIAELPTTMRTMAFQSDSVGYIGGNNEGAFQGGQISVTLDAGKTWKRVPITSDLYYGFLIEAIEALAPSQIWLGSNHGFVPKYSFKRMMFSSNGGATWDSTITPLPSTIHSIEFADDLIGFIGDDQGNIYATSDGGHTWTNDSLGARAHPIYAIHIVDGVVYASTDGIMYKKSIATSVTDETLGGHLTVFPNPTQGSFRLVIGATDGDRRLHSVVVLNALGARVHELVTDESEVILDLSPLPKGMYFINVRGRVSVRTTQVAVY